MRKSVSLSIYRAVCCAAQSSPKVNRFTRALSEESCIEIVGEAFLKHCGQDEEESAKDEL
jgi:hypothetical protein